MAKKIAINGFGRIGRLVFRHLLKNYPEIRVEAINDLSNTEILAHLLKYDSLYGIYDQEVQADKGKILIGNKKQEIKVLAERDPAALPWKEIGIDIVLECTGAFTNYDGAFKHITAGAKKVIIYAPSKDAEKIPSYILGVNADKYDPDKEQIMDMGSCTTNCLAPAAKVIHESFGIIKGFMTTVHSYTNDQQILDLAHKDFRRARAAGINIIPTTTGAAKAIGNVIPELKGKLDGIAFRVPTPTVSVLDLVCETEKSATAEEVNSALERASKEDRFRGILGIENLPLVSSDYIGNSFSSVVDSGLTRTNGNLLKIVAWYDNEWAYSLRLADFAAYIAKRLK
ncbi:MAG: type I glyceraldehyde-3-phosphate dehydrogenase [bacterium]